MADLIDYYNSGGDGQTQVALTGWRAQTFTPAQNYNIESVKLLLYKVGTPGDVTVTIQETTVGKPNGNVLATATVNGNDFLVSPGQWEEITFSSPALLSNGDVYAIVVNAASSEVMWRVDTSSPTYSGGEVAWSTNSGSSWTLASTIDTMFETWGTTVSAVEIVGTIVSTFGISAIMKVAYILAGTIAAVFAITGSLRATNLLSINFTRPGTYNPDKVYGYNTNELQWGWWNPEVLGVTGGGRYKQQLVVVGHNTIYYGVE